MLWNVFPARPTLQKPHLLFSTGLITAPGPVEAIKFRMDQSGLSIKDLEPIIGKSNRVYEVLSRKRPLTLAMIRWLHQRLGIPTDVLIVETVAG